LLLAACLGLWSANALAAATPEARLRYQLEVRAGQPLATVRIRATQSRRTLRELRLDADRLQNPAGDGRLIRSQGELRWTPPGTGGELRYQVKLDRQRNGRNSDGNDAHVGKAWALFRGEDAFPVRGLRKAKGAGIGAQLVVLAPAGWSVVTPYLPAGSGPADIVNPGGRMARPIGWIIAGQLGTRREFIEGLELTVSAPQGIRMERLAMLGLLRWNLPELLPVTGLPVRYVSITAAGPPMWLGALSAPNSVFVHADRPLISENGTSTILHEMVHVLLAGLETPRDQDWIDEGLAEYLSLRALRDSGTISPARFDKTLDSFREWGAKAGSLRTANSAGPVTARAVTIFHNLDQELLQATAGREGLDALVRRLRKGDGRVDLAVLRREAQALAGKPLQALAARSVPGFDVVCTGCEAGHGHRRAPSRTLGGGGASVHAHLRHAVEPPDRASLPGVAPLLAHLATPGALCGPALSVPADGRRRPGLRLVPAGAGLGPTLPAAHRPGWTPRGPGPAGPAPPLAAPASAVGQ